VVQMVVVVVPLLLLLLHASASVAEVGGVLVFLFLPVIEGRREHNFSNFRFDDGSLRSLLQHDPLEEKEKEEENEHAYLADGHGRRSAANWAAHTTSTRAHYWHAE